jgi:hypothetical protein
MYFNRIMLVMDFDNIKTRDNMKNFYRYLAALILITAFSLPMDQVQAGNKDRSGQAGAPELLINPWARSAGWGSVSTSNVMGLEGMFTNVAGLAFTRRTELIFAHTTWLKGSGCNISNFGLAQRLGESGVLGLSVFSMSFGELDVTTIDQPEGTGATFKPSLLNINLAYSKAFSNSIYGGIVIKIISESIPDASAQGIALDVGIQYVTGERDQAKFGVSLKNVGPKMKFTGDGFSIKAFFQGNDNSITVYQRSESFEMPAQLRIGASYDFLIGDWNRLTLAANFVSNSFTKDQVTLGLEYSLKEYLMLRGAYTYESGIYEPIENAERTNAYKGPSFGASVEIPFSKKTQASFAVDYSYQTTDHFKGTHTIGARLNF